MMEAGCSPLGPPPTPTSTAAPAMPLGWSPFSRFPPRDTTQIQRIITPAVVPRQVGTPLPSAFRQRFRDIDLQGVQRQPEYLYLWATNVGSAVNTVGFLTKHPETTTPAIPVASNTFYGTGSVDPYLMMHSWRLVDLKVVCAGAAVSQATVGANPVINIRFFQVNQASNTTLATLALPCISGAAAIGINNTSSGRTALIYFSMAVFPVPVEPPPATFFGWEFLNLTTDNNQINAAEVISSALVMRRKGR